MGGGAATVQLPDSVVDFFGKGGGGGALDAVPGLNLTEGAKLGAIMYTTNAPPGAYGGVTPSQLVSFSLATPADPESDDPSAEESSGETALSSGEEGSGEDGSGDESSSSLRERANRTTTRFSTPSATLRDQQLGFAASQRRAATAASRW